jgi:pyruvate dehydrogenase E2 component (dihydrolipoamide acetyltransferase)
MIRRVKLAKINLTMQTGTIVRWLKREGERVERDEPLLEVETDKAVNTVESFCSGYVKRILVPEGQEVPVDTLIAYIGEPEDQVPATPTEEGSAALPAAVAGPVREAAASPAAAAGPAGAPPRGGPINASPLARRLAAELGVDLAAVRGSGPDGRISKEDVLAAAQRGGAGPAAPAVGQAAPAGPAALHRPAGREVPLAGLKKLTGERMKASYLEAPHIHLDVSVNVAALESLRARLNAGAGAQPARAQPAKAQPAKEGGEGGEAERYTLTDLLVRAVSLALGNNPLLNSTFQEGRILAFSEQGIGLAVSSPGGLVVPVIRGCQRLNLAQIRDRRRELVARAREGRQTSEDLGGGTFTITNLGMYGVDAFRPILYPGQAGILAVGAVRHLALADQGGRISAQPVMQLTLGCDHRVVDGAEGAAFLKCLRELLEQPGELQS